MSITRISSCLWFKYRIRDDISDKMKRVDRIWSYCIFTGFSWKLKPHRSNTDTQREWETHKAKSSICQRWNISVIFCRKFCMEKIQVNNVTSFTSQNQCAKAFPKYENRNRKVPFIIKSSNWIENLINKSYLSLSYECN